MATNKSKSLFKNVKRKEKLTQTYRILKKERQKQTDTEISLAFKEIKTMS